MRLAVIPARGGSKRIKNKNVRDFCGKPLIGYALDICKKSELFDKIHVSTESEEVATVVQKLGHEIDFLRPIELADDFTGVIPVVQNAWREFVHRGKNYEDVL